MLKSSLTFSVGENGTEHLNIQQFNEDNDSCCFILKKDITQIWFNRKLGKLNQNFCCQ